MGVVTNSVQPGIFDPPDAVLDKVLLQIGVALVQIRHGLVKPSPDIEVAVGCRNIGIADRSGPVIRAGEFRPLVDPIRRGQVLHPPMIAPAVIKYLIHNHFHPFFVNGGTKFGEFFIGSDAGIGQIVIGDRIAMIGVFFLVILLKRIEPEGSDSQILQVIQVVGDPL